MSGQVCWAWPMLDQVRMAHSSSSPRCPHHTWTANMWCSARYSRGWSWCRILRNSPRMTTPGHTRWDHYTVPAWWDSGTHSGVWLTTDDNARPHKVRPLHSPCMVGLWDSQWSMTHHRWQRQATQGETITQSLHGGTLGLTVEYDSPQMTTPDHTRWDHYTVPAWWGSRTETVTHSLYGGTLGLRLLHSPCMVGLWDWDCYTVPAWWGSGTHHRWQRQTTQGESVTQCLHGGALALRLLHSPCMVGLWDWLWSMTCGFWLPGPLFT